MEFSIQKDPKSIIRVIGVGGAGGNAVTNMFESGIEGVDFAICNTDNQDLEASSVPTKIQLGPTLTSGLGAGNKPQVAKDACLESLDDIRTYLEDRTKMLFLTAGMGGGTGTGATPIIAKVAKEMGILTIGIITLPFSFEGPVRMRQAAEGLDELRRNVDALIVISNDKLRSIYGNMSMSEALGYADEILKTSAKGIAEIITLQGIINIDFNDVDTVMRDSGVAILGTASASGEGRAMRAVEEVLKAPLLADNDIKGAKNVLLNIVSGTQEATMDEIMDISKFVQEAAGFKANVIWGNCKDETMVDELSVTLIATGFERNSEGEDLPDEQQIVIDFGADEPVHLEPKENNGIIEPQRVTLDEKQTYKFEETESQIKKLNPTRFSYEDPHIKDELDAKEREKRRKELAEEARLRSQLRTVNTKRIANPEVLNELEKVPAFERRKVKLDDLTEDASEIMSSMTLLGDEDEFQLVSENSYIHKKVD